MLKKISSGQLRPGMFLHGLDRGWLDHPFWTKSFLLDARAIQKIVGSGIQFVNIDTEKGLEPEVLSGQDGNVPTESTIVPPQDAKVAGTILSPHTAPRTVLADELKHAKRLYASGCDQMKLVFQQARMGKAVSPDAMMPLVEAVSASVMRNPHALTSVARLKQHDGYTYMHSVAVCALMTALACELKLDEHMIRDAGAAGLMHDLGKAFMPLAVLNKPDKLTAEELEIAQRHPQAGWDLLESSNVAVRVREVVLHHHEKYDGNGYPSRLKGDDIPLLARMGAVCDVYDAVSSDRPYKSAWHPTRALRTMATWEGHFDKSIFAAFVQSIGIYPVGALVRLESGYLAVVLDQNGKCLSSPMVKTFFSTKSSQPVLPRVVDLEKRKGTDRILTIEDPRDWNFPHLTDLWLAHGSAA